MKTINLVKIFGLRRVTSNKLPPRQFGVTGRLSEIDMLLRACLPLLSVLSASAKPRLAGRQPSRAVGAPGDDLAAATGDGKARYGTERHVIGSHL